MIASLALFLLGSNYCLLGAWTGDTRMACGVVSPEPSAPGCHHPATGGDDPAPSASASCCPDPLLVPSGPSVDRIAALPAPPAASLLPAENPALACDVAAWHGLPPLPDGEPPTRLARAPLAARAPPLA